MVFIRLEFHYSIVAKYITSSGIFVTWKWIKTIGTGISLFNRSCPYAFNASIDFWLITTSQVDKNIERHTVHTIVSWPKPKQWVIVHTSDLMMIIRQSIYIYIYIKWTVFVNVTTKSTQHAHARMIYRLPDDWYYPWNHGRTYDLRLDFFQQLYIYMYIYILSIIKRGVGKLMLAAKRRRSFQQFKLD